MYSKNILNRFQNLQNVGLIKNASISSEVKDEETNALLRVYLNIEDDVITEAKFKCFGNILTTVTSDVLCDILIDEDINGIAELEVPDILSVIGEIDADKVYIIEFVLSITKELAKDYAKKLEKEQKEREKLEKELLENKNKNKE